MINILKEIEEKQMLDLLSNPNIWKSLDIDYHPPRVERIWCPVIHDGKEYRLYLHYIHSCEKEEALYHYHPWASAMHVISGTYEMGLGYKNDKEEIKTVATIVVDSGMYYEMVEPTGMHYVRPVNDISKTVMLTSKPWNIESTVSKSNKKLEQITSERVEEIRNWFRINYYNKYEEFKKW